MDKKPLENYTVEDFTADESFINYHFHLNKADELFWREWITSHPGKIDLVKKAGEMLQTLSITLPDSEYQQELSKITAAINKTEANPVFSTLDWNKQSRPSAKKRSFIYLVAASLLLIVGGYFLSDYFGSDEGGKSHLTKKVNTGNSTLIFTLSDSTVVTLAPSSTLEYPLQFKDGERNVYLEGNAGFTVTRNAEAPFKVYAENIVTTVLGTIFNIKKSGDTALIVDLVKGKLHVEINDPGVSSRSIILVQGESAVYVRSYNRLYKTASITPVNIFFLQNDFREIAAKIKAVFGITVINQSNKSDWRFTGEFKNNTAIEIIESVTQVKKLSYEVRGDTIVIK